MGKRFQGRRAERLHVDKTTPGPTAQGGVKEASEIGGLEGRKGEKSPCLTKGEDQTPMVLCCASRQGRFSQPPNSTKRQDLSPHSKGDSFRPPWGGPVGL